jgi:hypothetical protein
MSDDISSNPITNEGINRLNSELKTAWDKRPLSRPNEKENHDHDGCENRCHQRLRQPRKRAIGEIRLKNEFTKARRREAFSSSGNKIMRQSERGGTH